MCAKSPACELVGLWEAMGGVGTHSFLLFCQLSRVNNRSSAVRPIISQQTIIQIQVMTHWRHRGAFLLQQCMAHAFPWCSTINQRPGGGGTEEPPASASCPGCSTVSVGSRSPGTVVKVNLYVLSLGGFQWKLHHVWVTPWWGCWKMASWNCMWPTGLSKQLWGVMFGVIEALAAQDCRNIQ